MNNFLRDLGSAGKYLLIIAGAVSFHHDVHGRWRRFRASLAGGVFLSIESTGEKFKIFVTGGNHQNMDRLEALLAGRRP